MGRFQEHLVHMKVELFYTYYQIILGNFLFDFCGYKKNESEG